MSRGKSATQPHIDDLQKAREQIAGLKAEVRDLKESRASEFELHSVVLKQLLENSVHQIFVKDRDLKTILCNSVFANAIGKQPFELYGKTDIEGGWSHPAATRKSRSERAGLERSDREALSGKVARSANERYLIGAEIRVFNTLKLPLRNFAGEIFGFVGIRDDVTNLKQNASILSEPQFRTFFDAYETAVLVYDSLGSFIDCNDAALSQYGYTREEFLQLRMPQITNPGGHLSEMTRKRSSRAGKPTVNMSAHSSKRGAVFPVELHEFEILYNGTPATLGIVRNLAANARVSDARADSERRSRRPAVDLRVGLFQCSTEGRVSVANAEMLSLLDYEDSSDVEAGKAILRLRRPRVNRGFIKFPTRDQSARAFMANLVTKRGTERRVLVSLANTVGTIHGVMIDIDEAQRNELALRSAQTRLRHLSHLLLDAQEKERMTIAQELHDEIGQLLTAMKIDLQGIQIDPLAGEPDARVTRTITTLDRCLEEIRDLSLRLRPSLLDDLGLLPTLRWLAETVAPQFGLKVEVRGADLPSRLERSLEVVCYRVSQEALTNVARHATAQTATITLKLEGQRLILSIRDDGIGFDVRAAESRSTDGHSLGLLGIQERVARVGGTVEIRSRRGKGSSVTIRLPARFVETTGDHL